MSSVEQWNFLRGEPNTTLTLSFLLSSRYIPSLLNGQKAQSQAMVGSDVVSSHLALYQSASERHAIHTGSPGPSSSTFA